MFNAVLTNGLDSITFYKFYHTNVCSWQSLSSEFEKYGNNQENLKFLIFHKSKIKRNKIYDNAYWNII